MTSTEKYDSYNKGKLKVLGVLGNEESEESDGIQHGHMKDRLNKIRNVRVT
jgi:hypothetical protein